MNLYTLIFKKIEDGQEYEETIKAESDAAARIKSNNILSNHPFIVSYELYKSGDKITYTRDE